MADKKQQTTEQFLNEVLIEVFQDLHSMVVRTINASSVIDKLFETRVISDEDISDLDLINHRNDKCRRLLILLRNTKHPRAFVELRQAINDEPTYEWLVKDIDERYKRLVAAAVMVEPQVTAVSSNPSVTPLNVNNGDVTEANHRIDDLRRVFEASVGMNDDKERRSQSFVVTRKITKRDGATGVSETSKKLLFTLDQPPTDSNGSPFTVMGVVMLDKYLYVVYRMYNKVQVIDCEDCFKKIKDIEVKEMKSPRDMVGNSVTLQLFISEYVSDVIWRVDLKTGVSDVFVKTGYFGTRISLVESENRLLVTSHDSLLMFDIVSSERIKEIPLPEDIKEHDLYHAIESNRDSFFVSHGPSDNTTVSEINSEGQVIRVFDNKQQLDCVNLALDSVGRLLVTDLKNDQVVLFDENLKYERVLIDNKRLDYSCPSRLNYNKNNNRLTVGLDNGQVLIFEY